MEEFTSPERLELTALESAAEISSQMPAGDLGAAFSKMLFSLLIVVALLLASFWFLRRVFQNRMHKGNLASSIHILEKRALSPKTMLYLVKIEGKKILIAESQLEVKRLSENDIA